MSGERRRFVNLDTIVHLDNPACLIEINAVIRDDERHVQINLTDVAGEASTVQLDREQAGVVGYIVGEFDRRGVREFGAALAEGAALLREDEQR